MKITRKRAQALGIPGLDCFRNGGDQGSRKPVLLVEQRFRDHLGRGFFIRLGHATVRSNWVYRCPCSEDALMGNECFAFLRTPLQVDFSCRRATHAMIVRQHPYSSHRGTQIPLTCSRGTEIMKRLMKIGSAVALATLLCACGPEGILKGPNSGFISNVEVKLAKPLGSPQMAEAIRTKTLMEASRYPAQGEPKTLHILVTDLHKKNAAMSLLVGDANRMRATLVVTDTAGKTEHGRVNVVSTENGAMNGLIGAAIALAQEDQRFEDAMTGQIAKDALIHVHGSKAASAAAKNLPKPMAPSPAAAPAGPAKAAPAQPLKPAAPKAVPVAAAPGAAVTLVAAR
ncbi:hypothetical protein [Terrihabitans rhizophilus]|uniref:Lipoprotein n=1 Tax=Terrihabitans rhizophilus TaxID=3092662 RepID=A0ABU4RK17_9HYPH|nr:hypothetical protein [Terrihabitans sp. PJ23]MDX6805152.1 hypothetical protein [Terrihabitans sp. PJ23]